jgi:hypothetical protein
MSLNKNLLEEMSRFRLYSNYNPKKVLDEQFLNEEVQFDFKDRYFLMYYKKNGKPKLIEIGTLDVKSGNFLPTKQGNKLLGTAGESLPFSQVQGNQTFIDYRKVQIDEYGNATRIVVDKELDDFVEDIIEATKSYREEIKNREETNKGSDWGGKTSGSIILNIGHQQTYANAYNIPHPNTEFPEAKRLNLLEGRVTPPMTSPLNPNPDPEEIVTVIFDDVDINKTVKTYCDNMIKPNMSDPKVVNEMDDIIKRLGKYISAPPDADGKTALSKLTNITILGQADAATPGWRPGPPCTGALDHNYGGMPAVPRAERSADFNKAMNKFLATNRATEYKKVFLQRVKEKLGIDLVIKELPSIEYFGQGAEFRGEDYRSIKLRFNAPIHKYVNVQRQDPSPVKILIDKIQSKGYEARVAYLNTPQGVKQFTVIEKGKDLYVSENNIFIKKDEPKRGTMNMLHKYSYGIKASMQGMDLTLNTSAGEVTLKGQKGDNGDAMTAGMQSAFIQTWYPDCGHAFLEQAAISFSLEEQDFKDAFYTYKPDDVVTIENENYYRLYGFTYVLLPMSCTDKTSTPPSKKEILMNLVTVEPRYTDKQMKFLGKQVKKSIQQDLKDLEQIRRKEERKGEEIQNDIDIRNRRDRTGLY